MRNNKLLIALVIIIIVLMIIINITKDKNDKDESMNIKAASGDETQVLLYFADPNKSKLVSEYRYVDLDRIKENATKTLIEELLKGPQMEDKISTIPKDTILNSVKVEGNKAVVDLSKKFAENLVNEEEKLHRIYSVVNTLTEIKEIEKVEIVLDGESFAEEARI